MSVEHTPTPWRASDDGSISEPFFGGDWVADVRECNRAANAAFIVRAVNNFDGLVAALKEAISELNDWCEEESGEGYNNPRFNEILSKCEAQS